MPSRILDVRSTNARNDPPEQSETFRLGIVSSDQSGNRRPLIDLVRAVELVVPRGGVGDAQRLVDRGRHVLGRLRMRRGRRRSCRTSRRPCRRGRRLRRRRRSAPPPSGRGRRAGYDAASVESLGVRPNSLPITINVLSSRPRDSGRRAGRSKARSVGGSSLFFIRGKMSPWVSQVSLLPRLTWTRLTPASTSRKAISSDQPKLLRP